MTTDYWPCFILPIILFTTDFENFVELTIMSIIEE